MAHLYWWRWTRVLTWIRIPTPRFYIVLESESEFVPESVSGNVNEPLYCVMCMGALIVWLRAMRSRHVTGSVAGVTSLRGADRTTSWRRNRSTSTLRVAWCRNSTTARSRWAAERTTPTDTRTHTKYRAHPDNTGRSTHTYRYTRPHLQIHAPPPSTELTQTTQVGPPTPTDTHAHTYRYTHPHQVQSSPRQHR